MVYVMSLFIDGPGKAKCFCILYQIGSAALAFVILFQNRVSLSYFLSITAHLERTYEALQEMKYTYAFPSYAIVMSLMKEMFPADVKFLAPISKCFDNGLHYACEMKKTARKTCLHGSRTTC